MFAVTMFAVTVTYMQKTIVNVSNYTHNYISCAIRWSLFYH